MNLFDSGCLILKGVVKKQGIKWAEGVKTDSYSRLKCKHLQELLKARGKKKNPGHPKVQNTSFFTFFEIENVIE